MSDKIIFLSLFFAAMYLCFQLGKLIGMIPIWITDYYEKKRRLEGFSSEEERQRAQENVESLLNQLGITTEEEQE